MICAIYNTEIVLCCPYIISRATITSSPVGGTRSSVGSVSRCKCRSQDCEIPDAGPALHAAGLLFVPSPYPDSVPKGSPLHHTSCDAIMPSSVQKTSHIPITVFTGFLGAGKTSIILSLLPKLPEDYRVVLLKNEFGDVEGMRRASVPARDGY